MLLGYEVSPTAKLWSAGISLVFLGLTGLFLVMDLDRPDRFLNVLLRPQWNSWLVKGGYTITVFGLLVTIWAAMTFFEIKTGVTTLLWITAIFAILLAIYTAFLFAQAKGRDFWQSPTLPLHMLVHSVMAGTAIFAIASLVLGYEDWMAIF
jgi:formate-dependent nitrite reductase membrane component NrfD